MKSKLKILKSLSRHRAGIGFGQSCILYYIGSAWVRLAAGDSGNAEGATMNEIKVRGRYGEKWVKAS